MADCDERARHAARGASTSLPPQRAAVLQMDDQEDDGGPRGGVGGRDRKNGRTARSDNRAPRAAGGAAGMPKPLAPATGISPFPAHPSKEQQQVLLPEGPGHGWWELAWLAASPPKAATI